MGPCKHGHQDGALHRPCYQCKTESLAREIDMLERRALVAENALRESVTSEVAQQNRRREAEAELARRTEEIDRLKARLFDAAKDAERYKAARSGMWRTEHGFIYYPSKATQRDAKLFHKTIDAALALPPAQEE